MGKRKSKQSKVKKFSESSSCSSEITDIPDLTHPLLFENAHPSFGCSSTLSEIQNSLSDIYREYLKDLESRKQKRLNLKVPTSETQHYNLVINPTFRITMKSKISELLKQNYTCTLKNIIDEALETFLTQLQEFLKDSEDKSRLLQIVYLHEVFHSLQNSISEVSKILVELYSLDDFTKISLKKFYNTVLAGQKKLLGFAKSQDGSHFATSSVVKIFEDLDLLMKTGELKQKEMMFEVCSEVEEISEEPVHSLPLEELIVYINGSNLRKKNKNKAKKLIEDESIDKEVSEFEFRLASAQPSGFKHVPCCSNDFLKSLRDRYLEIRKKLLYN